MRRMSLPFATIVALAAVAANAQAGLVLSEFTMTSNSLRMTMSGTMPTLAYGTMTQIRISGEDGSDWMPMSADEWFMSNQSAFAVTNGSGGSSVVRIDAQAQPDNSDQIVIFFDNGGFTTGGTASGTVEFALSGGRSWSLSPTTTFRITATLSSGNGTDLFTGVGQSYSTPVVPGPAVIAGFSVMGLTARRRRR